MPDISIHHLFNIKLLMIVPVWLILIEVSHLLHLPPLLILNLSSPIFIYPSKHLISSLNTPNPPITSFTPHVMLFFCILFLCFSFPHGSALCWAENLRANASRKKIALKIYNHNDHCNQRGPPRAFLYRMH